ncbi:MAG: DUF2147 domain-containing protein [Spirochaetes bacterium]|nr:DUF2147 domain-containing protein [Spirochaetota bacterium]
MKRKVAFISAAIAAFFSITMFLYAQQSPVGMWKTVDDETGKEKSYLTITESNGKLYGTIAKLIGEPNDGKDKLCTKCTGSFKDKHLVGMTIMWGLKSEGSNKWSGGHIMDPNNGKTYRCLVELQNGGKKLRVRGFIGFSLLGRNQFWYRVK